MNAQLVADEILLLMAYAADLLMFPTFRRWNESYEGWLYSNGLLARLRHLEKQKLLARVGKSKGRGQEWVFEITDAGRVRICGGRDPEDRWRRKWDGWWRQFVFDLPMTHHATRPRLIRWLRGNGFGYLQDSVWISPDPAAGLAETLKPFAEDAEAFTVLECRCAPGFTNSSLVKAAWQFAKINEGYRAYQRFAVEAKRRLNKGKLHPRELFALLHTEQSHWATAMRRDPLLPLPLWPGDYEGRRAWQARKELIHLAACHAQPAQ
jgi:phenylacetic acid degradation operon negative regulatory protein